MEASEGKSNGGVEGDANSVKPSHGLKPEETIQSCMVDVSPGITSKPAKGKTDPKPDSVFPTDVEKCPASKQIHSFYFVKCRRYRDPDMKADIRLAENDIQQKNQEYVQLIKELKRKRLDRRLLNYQFGPLSREDGQYHARLESKIRELRTLYASLAKSHPSNIRRKESENLCSSEEELNCLIKGLGLRIQHERQTSAKERQLLSEIKLLEGTREQVIANSTPKAKVIGVDLVGVGKERQKVKKKFEILEDEKKRMDKEIRFLEKELVDLNLERAAIYNTLLELRKKCEKANLTGHNHVIKFIKDTPKMNFLSYELARKPQAFLNFVKKFAAGKDIVTLRELSRLQVEKFMERFNSDKAFRDGYKKRILPSLDSRHLNRDGRMKGPLENRLVLEELTSLKLQKPLVKPNTEATREEVISSPKHCNISTSEVHKEGIGESTWTEMAVNRNVAEDSENSSIINKLSRKWDYCTMVSKAQMLEDYMWGSN